MLLIIGAHSFSEFQAEPQNLLFFVEF